MYFDETRVLGIPHSCTIYKVQSLSSKSFKGFPISSEKGFGVKHRFCLLAFTLYYACYPRYLRAYRPIIASNFLGLVYYDRCLSKK